MDLYSAPKINIKDIFCDYTSISGVRFLHSRHPHWFRYLSTFVLIAAVLLFFYHISNFFIVLIKNRSSITLFSSENNDIIFPAILLCPKIPVLSCQWPDGTDCLSNVNETAAFEMECAEIITNSSFRLTNLFEITRPLKITVDYSDGNKNRTRLYLKMGKLTSYDYIASTERNVGLNTIIDSITENVETISSERMENGIFYNDANFAVDATRFLLSENDELLIAEFNIDYREGTFHQTSVSGSYTLLNLMIDLGSSLSLYFGFTVLTLFEVIIFFFYGRSDEITNLYPAPSKSVIYDLPNKKMVAKRSNNGDVRRKLAAEKQRQWNHALSIPPIY